MFLRRLSCEPFNFGIKDIFSLLKTVSVVRTSSSIIRYLIFPPVVFLLSVPILYFSVFQSFSSKSDPSMLPEISSVRRTRSKNLEELSDKAVSCCYARRAQSRRSPRLARNDWGPWPSLFSVVEVNKMEQARSHFCL
jgi:hypothetical protein